MLRLSFFVLFVRQSDLLCRLSDNIPFVSLPIISEPCCKRRWQ